MTQPRLYHYWRSSSSWRVRWALAHKQIAFETVDVNLLASEQQSEPFRRLNPNGYVPALAIDGHLLTESVAIVEYLDETRPERHLEASRVVQLGREVHVGQRQGVAEAERTADALGPQRPERGLEGDQTARDVVLRPLLLHLAEAVQHVQVLQRLRVGVDQLDQLPHPGAPVEVGRAQGPLRARLVEVLDDGDRLGQQMAV
ncbi:MAG: hypothetical protein EOO75_15520, partial [Myxococcales bacterium]